MSQTGKQIIAIHVLPNIPRSNLSQYPNQTIKFAQYIFAYNVTWEVFSFKNHAKNKTGKPVLDLFLFFDNALYKQVSIFNQSKGSVCYGGPLLGRTIKRNWIGFQSVDPEIYSILTFYTQGLGLASPHYFVYDFGRIIFLMLYFFKWPNFIVYLPLLLEMLGNFLK